MKELDGYIPDGFEGALIEKANAAPAKKLAAKTSDKSSDHFAKLGELTGFVVDKEPSKVIIISNFMPQLALYLFS